MVKRGNYEAEKTQFWGEKSGEGAIDKWERSYGIHTWRRLVLFVELVEKCWRSREWPSLCRWDMG
jgi:hypothetical protein